MSPLHLTWFHNKSATQGTRVSLKAEIRQEMCSRPHGRLWCSQNRGPVSRLGHMLTSTLCLSSRRGPFQGLGSLLRICPLICTWKSEQQQTQVGRKPKVLAVFRADTMCELCEKKTKLRLCKQRGGPRACWVQESQQRHKPGEIHFSFRKRKKKKKDGVYTY